MSNAQHLIENAICCIENGETYEDFSCAWYNQAMSKASGIDLEAVFDMAVYVIYTAKPDWVCDTIAYFQGREPLDDKMKEYIERFI